MISSILPLFQYSSTPKTWLRSETLVEKAGSPASDGVLIIGGGISGMTVALELAQSGIPATLVERETSIGGLSASFCCKASESCNKCFACVVDKRVSDIRNRGDIPILTQTEPIGLSGGPGQYAVSLKKERQRIDM